MIFTVKAVDFLSGSINLPASKSYTIRAFIIAACAGTSKIIGASNCDDAIVAIDVAKKLGAKVTVLSPDSYRVLVTKNALKYSRINVKESGTALRFLLPLLALRKGKFIIVGKGTLKGRPNLFLNQTLRGMGANIKGTGRKECIPITIKGGGLRGGRVTIDGSLSSQFISALLIACPALDKDTNLRISGKRIVSKTYITMTQKILHKAGIKVRKSGHRSFYIKGNQKFKGIKSFRVPSDYGLAAFFLAAAVLTHSKIILRGNLKDDLPQADGEILSFLRRMGVKFKKTASSIKIEGPQTLKGGNFSLKDCPDLVPIMTVMALFAKCKTRLYDIRHVRAKESDRISDLRHELIKIGARIKEKENELIVYPNSNYKNNIPLDPHRDHRLAMSFCVLGLKLGVRVKDIECTGKSYPGFIRDFKGISIPLI